MSQNCETSLATLRPRQLAKATILEARLNVNIHDALAQWIGAGR